MPVASWLQASFGAVLEELVADAELGRYFDLAEERRLVSSRPLGAWSLLNFALWHRYWIRDESLDPLLERAAAN